MTRTCTRDRVIGLTYRPYPRTPHVLDWATGPYHQPRVPQTDIHSESIKPLRRQEFTRSSSNHSVGKSSLYRLVSLRAPKSHSTKEDQESPGAQRSGHTFSCINCNECARYLAPLNPLLTPSNGSLHGGTWRTLYKPTPAPFHGFATHL